MFDWSYILDILGEIVRVTFNLVYFCIVLGTVVVVVLDNRNPVKTIAWILVLMFLPFIGLLFYFFFGRSRRRERIISRKSFNRLLKKPMAEYLAQSKIDLPQQYSNLARLFENTNQSLLFDGNDVEIYTDGYSKLLSLIRELSRARHHIHMEYYIIEDDPVGRLVRDVLVDKARQGVEVRVICDDVGCWRVPTAFFESMREAGIEVRHFLKVRFPLFTSRVNYRNHRKIVVIDGRVGFVGGMNLAQRYYCGLAWGVWRDTHIRVSGRAVHGLQTAFLLDWYFVDRTLITASRYFPRIEQAASSAGGEQTSGVLMQIVTSDPVGPWRDIMMGLAKALSGAQRYFYMQTPYFLPTEQLLFAMQTAALAGVDVRLMLPQRADSRIIQWASRSYVADALRAGVKVYFYNKGFIHSKLMVADDMLSSIGSANLDFRSFEHNFEVNAFMYDAATARRMRDIFVADQRYSTQVFLKNWEKRPWRKKALESVVRLLAPLL
jgi:cardiolipin synthase